ncbi:MAG: T9SS type A sorting domain-containing protein [Hymenobacteraceae bacterium]|nr:T9SS type A sorting domain-containing protein [Hymenobacteraceae bacterium]
MTPRFSPALALVLLALVFSFTTAFHLGRRAVSALSAQPGATAHSVTPMRQAQPKEQEEQEEQEGAGRHLTPLERWQATAAPNDQFELVRAWPDRVLDRIAYQSALDAVQAEVAAQARTSAPSAFNGLWQLEGPGNIGGRFNAIAVHPTNPAIMYAGAAAGGLFKTTNGGGAWAPIFDDRPNLVIGCITFDPRNPTTLFVGTGDPGLGSEARIGQGVWKSTNGGTTWTNIGLQQMGIVMHLAVHPTNSQTMWAATMGKPMVRDANRGVYKTINGGTTWTKVLATGTNAGAADLLVDPVNPQNLYATTWNRIRTNQESLIFGPAAKVWKSTNGGTTWTVLTAGLPSGSQSRMGLAMAPSAPQTLYCSVIDTTLNLGGLYKTTNGGTSWTRLPVNGLDPGVVNGFGWYFEGVFVHPTNPNLVFFGGVDLWRSTDGGQNFSMAGPPWFTYEVHADKHDMAFIGANTVVLTTDGGIYRSTDRGDTWTDIDDIPVTQFYRVTVNPHVAGDYWGGAQDNGTSNGNAASLTSWNRVYGGDGFQVRFDPTDPATLYVETQNGDIAYSDNGGNSFGQVAGFEDRRNWDMPYLLKPSDPTTLFTGGSSVYRMDNAPNGSWTAISPHLTHGLIFAPRFHTISTVAASTVSDQVLYAGTTDANVWRTLDDGATWRNVTGPLPNRYVTCVRASPNTAGTVYVSHSGYKYNDFTPHLHKSTNNGTTWTSIAGNLPNVGINSVLGYPGSDRILFVATDAGVYATINGGTRWDRVGTNMPVFSVYDLDLDAENHRLIAGTFARSIQSFELGRITGRAEDAATAPLAVQLYPNPATDVVRVDLPTGLRATAVRVLDARGQLVARPVVGIETPVRIDVRALRPGPYVLELRVSNGATVRRRFVRE